MMKSFFKKLAFVMALAMVVTTAAPAATASAAEKTEFTYAYQEAGKVTTLYMMADDEPIDLKFVGVKDYKNYELEWVSLDEEVATVDQKGIVTAVADGETYVQLKVKKSNYTSKPVKVVVGEEPTVVLGESKNNTYAAKTLEVGTSVDLGFYGVPNYNKANYTVEWKTSDDTIAKIDQKGVVVAMAEGTAVVTLAVVNNVTGEALVVTPVIVTVVAPAPTVVPTEAPAVEPTTAPEVSVAPTEAPEATVAPTATPVPEMIPVQKTAKSVEVTFSENHSFDATGTDANDNTVKVYRKFSSDEMAKMSNTNGLKFDEEGNGYQAYYVMSTKGANNVWTITGYTWFVDGARYAVVYGDNETSSTINGIQAEFTAYIGKVAYIEISATVATVESEVEPAIPAVLSTKLYNAQDIDLTDYYKNADETEYELVTEEFGASLSGNEVTFEEAGAVQVMGTYTYYDEAKEDDVVLTDDVDVFAKNYTDYSVDRIVAWTLDDSKWTTPVTDLIAGDPGQLYVIVADNRGNYYTNGNVTTYGGKSVAKVGDGIEDTTFEQYGYELVFDSLDPDSLLVDYLGRVETYKETQSFAVVSYKRTVNDNVQIREIGIMGINVKPARVLDSVNYKNGINFTILKETEAEITDGAKKTNAYAGYADFKLSATLKVELWNQYKQLWGENAEDWGDVKPHFTVTTSKDAFDLVAEDIANALNKAVENGKNIATFNITYYSVFYGTDATSVSFKIKESATGDSTTVTIKLDEPKYVTENNVETTEVYVDPTRAILEGASVELYKGLTSTVKLFQVSKASQKIGYYRVGSAEVEDEIIDGVGRSYYVANELTGDFEVAAGTEYVNFVSTASGSSLVASGTALAKNDYVLVVTDPQGRIFPAVGNGGNGKSFGIGSGLGVDVNADGTAYVLNLAAYNTKGELEYAVPGTYRVSVYKISSVVTSTGSNPTTKYNVTRVASDSFSVTKDFRDVTFYHQEATKDVDLNKAGFETYDDVLLAISKTMSFKIAGQKFGVDTNGVGKYNSYLTNDKNLRLEIVDIDYKIQDDKTRAVVNTVTFKVYTVANEYYTCKVKVNRSVNAAE